MPLEREQLSKAIHSMLHQIAAELKGLTRNSLTDGPKVLEVVMQRFLNALNGWELTDLNQDRANYPAADLGDKSRRIAVQVTNREDAEKIKDTHAKALDPKHALAREFDTLYILFFIPTRKPSPPKGLLQSTDRPRIETWDLSDLLDQMLHADIERLRAAHAVLESEMSGHFSPVPMKTAPSSTRTAFISHSTADDGYVAELESLLRASGFQEVFNDVSSIKPDEKFWPEIEKGICGCEVFYCVIGEKTKDSDWVRREVELARHLAKAIVPVWIEGAQVPAFFEGRDVVDFRVRKRNEEVTREKLIADAAAGMTSEQLLDLLGGLNRAMFAEVLFHFDPKNQIPGGELSQRERAMELIKLARAKDGGLPKLILFIAKLRSA